MPPHSSGMCGSHRPRSCAALRISTMPSISCLRSLRSQRFSIGRTTVVDERRARGADLFELGRKAEVDGHAGSVVHPLTRGSRRPVGAQSRTGVAVAADVCHAHAGSPREGECRPEGERMGDRLGGKVALVTGSTRGHRAGDRGALRGGGRGGRGHRPDRGDRAGGRSRDPGRRRSSNVRARPTSRMRTTSPARLRPRSSGTAGCRHS